jgi:gas vesicle protein
MNEVIIGLMGGLVGSIITSIVSLIIFSRKSIKESNRHFMKPMLETIQRIYLATQKNILVSQDDLDYLLSFKIVGLKSIEKFKKEINEIQKLIISYNVGVEETITKTETSSLQISSKTELDDKLRSTVDKLYKIT